MSESSRSGSGPSDNPDHRSADSPAEPEKPIQEQTPGLGDQQSGPVAGSDETTPAPLWLKLSGPWRAFLTDQVTPVRLASHVALLLVAGLVLILSRVHLPDWEVVRLAPVQVEDSAASGPELALNQLPVGGSPLQESGVLLRAPVPFTEIPDRPREGVITYTVQIDDTVLGIGEKFNLDPNTIVWANLDDLTKPFVMAVGEVLLIPPVDGVLHTVEEGDTVDTIATKYRSSAEKIVGFPGNQLAGAETPLTPGQVLMVPDGDRLPPAPPPSQSPSAPWRTQNFVWPAFGRLTQGYWLPAHPAIDIGAPAGSTARAADSGTVITAGWSTVGYGNYVVIRHYDGFVTLYAHLNRIDVSTGEQVERGQQIGIVGSTGHSTGPHLHFEVSLNGRTYNPLIYLP